MWNVIWLENDKVFRSKEFQDEKSAKVFYAGLREYYKRIYKKGNVNGK